MGLPELIIGLTVASIAASAGTTVVGIRNSNAQAEFQHEQARQQAERAKQATEANVRAAARAARRETARLQAGAAGDIFGPTLEVRQSQAVRDALTEARNRNFVIAQRSSEQIAGMQFREQTARLAAINAGLQGTASILGTASRAAGMFLPPQVGSGADGIQEQSIFKEPLS